MKRLLLTLALAGCGGGTASELDAGPPEDAGALSAGGGGAGGTGGGAGATGGGAGATGGGAGATGGGTGSTGGGAGGLTTWEQDVLATHNQVRANAMPTPSPALPVMSWSATAATQARDWASRCNFQHRNPNTLGENLFASTNERTGAAVVNDWASEVADYTYASNSCRLGKACGHYTQIVWRSSVGLGCAQQRCTTGSPFGGGTWFLVVCNYDPAGNFTGQKPY